jgi:hypothetical protein
MNEHALFQVMRSTPINSAARRVVKQGNSSHDEDELSRAELVEICERLERKSRLLKKIIGIENKAQHKNLKNSVNGKRAGGGIRKAKNHPRAVMEYLRCGMEIHRMIQAIGDLKVAQKASSLVESEAAA